jgi:hypothetical protein
VSSVRRDVSVKQDTYMNIPVDGVRPTRGRPRKFAVPSRAITLTLPEHVIEALAAIDADLSRAVVRLIQPQLRAKPHAPAELARFGRRAVIVVNPTRTLHQRTGVDLVPLPDGRALISFERSLTIPALELMISDALEDTRLSGTDRAIFQAIAEILRDARRSDAVVVNQRNIIVLEARHGRPAASRKRGRLPATGGRAPR